MDNPPILPIEPADTIGGLGGPEGVAAGPRPGGTSLPIELVQALTVEQNPYELLGREYARRVQLEGVVAAMQAFLKTLVTE